MLAALLACSDQNFGTLEETELFVQEELVASDVLFVIDDSPSMSEEQARVADNFDAFEAVLTASEADWQVGVVTTDASTDDAGVLRGGVMTPDTPDLATAVRAAVEAGTDGSRDEQGLRAAGLALDPARNPGFVREGARLNLVFVSDEDDHSPGQLEDYLNLWARHAGDAGFAANALVGEMPQGCASGTSAADAGPRYLDVVDATDGLWASICAEDYSGLLEQVGFDAAGLQDTFALAGLPSPESLEVRVDGVLIPAREVDGWSYDSGDNAVVFSGRAVPRPGMQVEVSYVKWVGPA